jgi:hypothetical protein
MVRSQIVNLTLSLSFDHNLCFRCPNESCDPNLHIYILVAVQWYKKFFKKMGFDPCTLNIRESIWDFNSQNGSSLGSVRVHSLTIFALPRACEVSPRLLSWPATLQPPCFGRDPKFRVATYLGRMLKKQICMIHQGSFKMLGHHPPYHGLNPRSMKRV